MQNYEKKFKQFLTEGIEEKREERASIAFSDKHYDKEVGDKLRAAADAKKEKDAKLGKVDESESLKEIEVNLGDSIAAAEAEGLSEVFGAYANNAAREDIMEIGFNPNSGYVYIALENGISIASMMGRDPEYLVTDMEDGEEFFLDTYREAEEKQEELMAREDEE